MCQHPTKKEPPPKESFNIVAAGKKILADNLDANRRAARDKRMASRRNDQPGGNNMKAPPSQYASYRPSPKANALVQKSKEMRQAEMEAERVERRQICREKAREAVRAHEQSTAAAASDTASTASVEAIRMEGQRILREVQKVEKYRDTTKSDGDEEDDESDVSFSPLDSDSDEEADDEVADDESNVSFSLLGDDDDESMPEEAGDLLFDSYAKGNRDPDVWGKRNNGEPDDEMEFGNEA